MTGEESSALASEDTAGIVDDMVATAIVESVDESRPNETKTADQRAASKEDVVRTPRSLAQATIASSNKRVRSPNSPRGTRPAISTTSQPTPPTTTTTPSAVMPRQSTLSGPNPFYNDIAPLYAKFLNSAEVKRF